MAQTTESGFFIEVTSHCRDSQLPRWSFWIRNKAANEQGMIGTDRHGRGLYQYSWQHDRAAAFRELVSPEHFSLSDQLTRQQANVAVTEALERLGWGKAQAAPAHIAPSVGLFAIATS